MLIIDINIQVNYFSLFHSVFKKDMCFFSITLLRFYHEFRSLIDYTTHYLFTNRFQIAVCLFSIGINLLAF